jgi:iron complex transport system ATP-binding protein
MIEIENLKVSLGRNEILNDITMNIMEGEIIGLIGKAGTGKTVLLKTIANHLKMHSGKILYDEMSFPSFIKQNKNNRIHYVNNPMPDNMDDSVYNFLLLARARYRKMFQDYSGYDIQIAEEYINLFNLESYREYSLGSLSSSIMQRVLLSFSFIQMAKYMLLDNPTNNCDIKTISYLMKAVSKYTMNGNKAIVIASNDLNFISQTTDRVIILDASGKIAIDGPPEIISRKLLKEYFDSDVLISRNIYNGRPEIHYYSES